MKRTIALSAAALLLPVALAAQQAAAPASPPAAAKPAPNAIAGAIGTLGTMYGDWLTAAFDSIPASKYGYKPTPVQMTVGQVAVHLENANYFLCTRFSSMTHPLTAKDSLADTVKALWPKDTLVGRLKASLAFCKSAIESLDDAKLAADMPVGPPGSGKTAPRTRYVVIYVTDLADHYSQIANYMRLNNMIPPTALPKPKS